MNSMGQLNTSLPSANARGRRPEPPEELLQAFKTAALSVTNLYKNAVSGESHARHLGYQEALEDMLGFLNREGLALGSIDGAKIRHWLTERIDGTAAGAGDEASAPGDEQPQRAPTPAQTTTTVQTPQASTTQPQAPTTSDVSSTPTPPQPAFTFSAGPEFPTYQPPKDPEDMQLDGSEHPRPLNPNSVFHPDNIPSSFTTSAYPCTSTPNPAPTSTTPNNFLFEVMSPRPSRTNMRSNSGEGGVNVGLGSKRKFQFGDFFDISGLGNNGRDGFGPNGGKRGRFT